VKIVLTGKTGQLGADLQRSLAPLGEVIALDRAALDLARPDQVAAAVRELAPEVLVNAAAYTAVERAEREPELAHAVNAVAPGVMAEETRRIDALLVHFSTDYVFNGAKESPYSEQDEPSPLNAYGRTKLAGERAVREAGGRWIVLRTSWLYSKHGRNFLLAILEKARREKSIPVVSDQIGAPTWTRMVAEATATAIARDTADGLFHLTASGSTTWFAFAEAIVRAARLPARITPILASAYGGVTRPRNSLLSNERFAQAFGIRLPHWSAGLESCMQDSG